MSRYKVSHKTGFSYTEPVVASYNEVRMLPIRDESQLVFNSKLEINPHPASHEYLDYFGNRVVMFEVLEPHVKLEITSTTSVELRLPEELEHDLDWQSLGALAERDLLLRDYLSISKRTQVPAELARFAHKWAATSTPVQTAVAICQYVHSKLKYQPGVTGVNSNGIEAWTKKVGVCQDFTHLTLGAMRSVGIPARYVSGYLHPQVNPVIGEKVLGESHAWVEWFGGEWIANDPTNNLEQTDRHIAVARGRDYDDVPPLRGVYAGISDSELFVSVEVTREA